MLVLPEIGKTYNCYDDGKITKPRQYHVTVTGIIVIDDIKDDYYIYELLNYNIEETPWLFAGVEHKYLLETVSDEAEILKGTKLYLAMTNEGFWFGLGYWYDDGYPKISSWFNAGRLDVENKFNVE